MSGIPQGLGLGSVLLNIFNNNIDSEIECTRNRFADDTKLHNAIVREGMSSKGLRS